MTSIGKGILASVLVIGGGFNNKAVAANASVVDCSGCSSAAQISKAERAVLADWRRGMRLSKDVVVFDPATTAVSQFVVSVSDDFRDRAYWDKGGALVFSRRVETPAELIEFRRIVAQGLKVKLPPDRQYPINAYQDIENPTLARNVNSYLINNGPSMYMVSVFDVIAGKFGFEISKLGKVLVVVEYAGGQRRTYEWDGQNKKYKPVPGTAIDDSGNRIPEKVTDVAPRGGIIYYNFKPDRPADLDEFFDRLGLLGIPVYNQYGKLIKEPPRGGGGGGRGYVCVYGPTSELPVCRESTDPEFED